MNQMTERLSAEIFRFENPGDYLKGVLVDIETVDISGKPTLRYILHDLEENRRFSILGTMDLNNKVRRGDLGKPLEIRYEGLENRPGKNPIKRYRVLAPHS